MRNIKIPGIVNSCTAIEFKFLLSMVFIILPVNICSLDGQSPRAEHSTANTFQIPNDYLREAQNNLLSLDAALNIHCESLSVVVESPS